MFIWLFGSRFDIDGTSSYKDLGGDKRFNIAVYATSKKLLKISLREAPFFGPNPASRQLLEGEWSFEVNGCEVTLGERKKSSPALWKFAAPFDQNADQVLVQLIKAPTDLPSTLGLVLIAEKANDWRKPLAPIIDTSDYISRFLIGASKNVQIRWQSALFWVVSTEPTTLRWAPVDGKAHSDLLLVSTGFNNGDSDAMEVRIQQALGLSHASFDGSRNALTIDCEVERGDKTRRLNQDFHYGLLISTDILDPDAEPLEENHLQAHQLLANGMLRYEFEFGNDSNNPSPKSARCNWVPKPGATKTILISFGLTDEFSLPFALVADAFPLTSRAGVTGTRSKSELFYSNSSILIGQRHGATVDVEIRSIRPESVDIGAALPDARRLNWLFGPRGLIELAHPSTQRMEVHGFASGSYLKGPASTVVTAKIHCEPFEYENGVDFPSFIFSKIEFQTDLLDLHIQSPERQYCQLANTGHAGTAISEIGSTSNSRVSLPLFDYNYALINRASGALASPGPLSKKKYFLERAAAWLDELNKAAGDAFRLEESASQLHQSGFAKYRVNTNSQTLHALFAWPAGEARVADRRKQLSVLERAAPIRPLAIASRGSPIVGSDNREFLHGGESREEAMRICLANQMNTAEGPITAFTTAAAELSLANLYKRFAILWGHIDSPNAPPDITLVGPWSNVQAALTDLRERVAFGGVPREFPPPETYNRPDPLLAVVDELRRIIRGDATLLAYGKDRLREFEKLILAANDGNLVFDGALDEAVRVLRKIWLDAVTAKTAVAPLLSSLLTPATHAVFTLALEALTAAPNGGLNPFAALATELPGFDNKAITDLREIDAMLTSIADGLPNEALALERLWSDRDALKTLLDKKLPGADLDRLVEEVTRLRLALGSKLAAGVYASLLAQSANLSDEIWHLFVAWTKTYAQFANYPLFIELQALWNAANPTDILKDWVNYAANAKWDFYRIEQLARLKSGVNFRKLAHQCLAALRFEPPDYLLFSSRLPMQTQANETAARLWNHAFPMATPSAPWKYMLDGGSTVILKLSGKRKLRDLLREAASANTSPAIPDPLGVVVNAESADTALGNLIKVMDAEVLDTAAWRGIVVIRPTLDLAEHQQLRDLLGLRHFEMDYVAVGGMAKDTTQKLNTYAYVQHTRQQDEISAERKVDPSNDVGLALVKFEAKIRNATLVSGEVVLNLYLTNLWGKKDPSGIAKRARGRAAATRVVVIRGTVPQDDASGTFEFAADLPTPIDFNIDIAFIEKFTFKGIRVGTHDGKTALEIDGSLTTKAWPPLMEKGGKPISLQDFRILIPPKVAGSVTPMGENRWLQFDFPSIHIPFPGAKAVELMQDIDIRPEGIGFVRDAADGTQRASAVYKGLIYAHVWLFEQPSESGIEPGTVLPYMNFSVNFGKFPQFGGTGMASLRFEMMVGILISPKGNTTTIIGISSLDAKKVSLNIFGIIKLYLEELFVGGATYGKGASKTATVIVARKLQLSVCGWEPFKSMNLLMAQYTLPIGGTSHSAFLATAVAGTNGGGGTVKLNWIVLGRNLELDSKQLDYLFKADNTLKEAEIDRLFKDIVALPAPKRLSKTARRAPDQTKRLASRAALTIDLGTDGAWLMALRGKIGSYVEDGVLVLHDQRYYGIRLKGGLIKAMIGKDTLELAYIPGATRELDRFRTTFRIPALNFIVGLEAGEFGIEWGFNWSFLLDFFFPWKRGGAYLWERAARMPMGTYEAKFGFYFERRLATAPEGATDITLAAGVAFYIGYYWGMGSPDSGVWVRAGIGVFAIFEGAVTLYSPKLDANDTAGVELLRTSVKSLEVNGVIGIYAYAEGGIRIWILSASIIASIQAAIATRLLYIPSAGSTLSYAANLAAHYEASVRVGSGFFSWTFSVSGDYAIEANGTLCMS